MALPMAVVAVAGNVTMAEQWPGAEGRVAAGGDMGQMAQPLPERQIRAVVAVEGPVKEAQISRAAQAS